ncbi:unnamed protein product [Closterium sp. NIES-54]
MAGREERGGRVAGGSGVAQAQGQPRDSAMAPMQPSLGPPRDEPRVFGLDKFNGDNFAEWSFKMENIFDHYDLLEVMEGTEKRPENDPEKSPWTPAQGQEGRGAGGGRGRGRGGRGGRGGGAASMKSAGNESESRDDRFPGQFFFVSTQAPAGPEKDESFEEPAAVGKVTLHSLDYWVIDSGATYSMTPRADLLTELEPSPVKHVTSALGQQAEVKGMGKAMFKGADGKMVGLKNVLWVPNLAANLISVRRLQKAGMDTSSKGAKTYTARLGKWILWDLHDDRDVYNEMWQIRVVPMPKERQVAASISTKGEAVGSGDGANGRAKEMKSKKCNLGGTSKLGEHEESGAAAQKQHKGEVNPKAAAEEEYGENMWGTIASAAFSNPTSATGECDWLTLHQGMGHVALPILQQLVKNKMVAGIRVKGEPDEVLGCPACMQAKFTRYPFSSSEATAKAPLDEVVMDVVGPLKLGAAGAEYILTIVDVYTWMTWVYVLSKKTDVAETVKTDWLPMVERQQDRLVKAIRTDRGGEFRSKEFSLWLKKNGIRHSLTMPYSPAMNGIAERANRTITETARGLLIEAGLPKYFWPDAVRSACVAKNRALTHVGADKWVLYVEWIGRKPKLDMLRVFGCMCMALVPKHLRHNKLGAKAIWAVHLGMAQNSKGWLFWDPFTKKFLVSRDCKFMENLMYKEWKEENEAKICVRFGDVKSSGLEHVELPLKLSSSSTITRQSSLVNGGEEAKDAEEEEEEVQQVSECAPTLPSRTTSAPRIRVTPQQRQGLHVPAAEEEGRGKRRIQAPNRLTYDALGKPAKSALAGAALMVGEDEESDYEECAFAFFSPVEMPGEPTTLKEALESSDAEEWKKAMESELKSIVENGTWELVELPEGRKAITSKWLFKIKSDADAKIERYKSRLCVKGPEEESVGEEERRRFHSLVGSLMYAAVNTRPDVTFPTGQLARVVQCPNEEQVAAGMRVAKYLGQTPTVGLQYSAAAQRHKKGADCVEPGRLFLTAFSDTSLASEPDDMTSVEGFIFCVGGGPTAWESKKHVDQALSSVESKYMALFRAVREIVWQRRLLAELGEEQQGPTPLYCDSQGTRGTGAGGPTTSRQEALSPERLREWGSPGGGASHLRAGCAGVAGPGDTGTAKTGGSGAAGSGVACAGSTSARRQERLPEWAVQWGSPGGGASRAQSPRAGGTGGATAVGSPGGGAGHAGAAGSGGSRPGRSRTGVPGTGGKGAGGASSRGTSPLLEE